ncbi:MULTISPECIES: GNAT family N-acetyltransferase [Morganellaceae]|uniref:GNAT family N-acetyltransferase n=1 Tax=Morganellaceae TaxID=1903414 RepID=UPI001495220B|nr:MULTISPECIES: GNAT family N-acetyltransferase [Providencia]NPD43496.1 GNAT family N-acetyltransferase [Providencia stuartii]NPD96780.1 GNAT family N-acetyltransferase [Providencia stuartii]
MKIEKIKNINILALEKFIHNTDNEFTPSLSSRINISIYAKKLAANSVIFAIKEGDIIIGLVACYANDFIEKKAYIPYIAIDKKYRGYGYSKLLLDSIIDYLNQNEFKLLSLTVRKNSAAYNLYKKYNFIEKKEFLYTNTKILGCDMELQL